MWKVHKSINVSLKTEMRVPSTNLFLGMWQHKSRVTVMLALSVFLYIRLNFSDGRLESNEFMAVL